MKNRLISCGYPAARRRNRYYSLVLTAGFVMFLALGVSAHSATDDSVSQYQITPHMHGAPIPCGPGAPSQADFQKIYTAWLNRTIMAHFPADKDPDDAGFMRDALDYLGSDPRFSAAGGLLKKERAYSIPAVNEPGLLFMIGAIEPATPRQHDAYAKALTLLPASAYPKFIWFTAAANVGKDDRAANADAGQLAKDDQLSLQYLEDGLSGAFNPGEMSVLRWRFDAGSFRDLFSRNAQRVADIFESTDGIDRWVKDYVEGVKFVEAAWNARGGDWANNVSPEGWKGFAQNLAFARSRLVNSWTANPHDPAAAAEMITVCMGENEQPDSMRSWFDHSVAADFDYLTAYQNYRWGLRPRWLGSYPEMYAFGQECAATGRYDTMVPNELVATYLDISDDSKDHGDQFKDPKNADPVLTVLDTYLAQPHPCIWVGFSHTVAAIVADKAGRKDERDRHMAAIHYKPTINAFLKQLANVRQLAAEAQADASPAQSAASPAPSATP